MQEEETRGKQKQPRERKHHRQRHCGGNIKSKTRDEIINGAGAGTGRRMWYIKKMED